MASDDPSSREAVSQAAYKAAYPRVADALTLYLWREPALNLTRWAARAGLAPHVVTVAAALLAVLTFLLFWNADHWWGLLSGLAFGLVEVAGTTYARRAGGRPKWAGALDIIVPPLWWWAWEHGLAATGRPLEPVTAILVLWAIFGGYGAERVIEWLFVRRSGGTRIDEWKKIDSRFRLLAAGTNVNLLILAVALLFGRPDAGLALVAWWTIASVIFQAVRLAQANEQAARGQPITSWLEG